VLGTDNARVADRLLPNPHTTPEAPDIYDLLLAMRGAGAELVAMEVSSHALELERVVGLVFDVAVFSYLARDHLDFHSNLDAYAAAKEKLFSALGQVPRRSKPAAVVNSDDPLCARMAAAACAGGKANVATFGLHSSEAQWRAQDVHTLPSGTRCTVLGPGLRASVGLKLLGAFNVVNLLGALAAAAAAGLPAEASLEAMCASPGAPGRFELVPAPPGGPTVVVDYAHKPDSLREVLATARAVSSGQIITVFGCGGDRDRGKRPLMGALVAELSDRSWVTSDNPRSEDPDAIIREIVAGLEPVAAQTGHRYSVEPDRARAISAAISAAGSEDLVLIAGKGHEPYQIFADRTIHFDDREQARAALEARSQPPVRSQA
jgi:UDP-N-acetylmuramoyl-L-alanyl-D-glutamate--2,6-diaminopimelate ligase